jgi:hypothetical protein
VDERALPAAVDPVFDCGDREGVHRLSGPSAGRRIRGSDLRR